MPVTAISHVDGICLNCSVALDGVEVTREGHVVHPELTKLAAKLDK